MSSKKNRHKKPPAQPAKASRLIAWTTVLALVFSAGLITGQRLIERQGTPPLVSVSSAAPAMASPDASGDAEQDAEAPDAEKDPVAFSFYNRLSGKEAGPGAPNKELSDAVAQLEKPEAAADALPARYTLQIGAHPAMHKAKTQLTKLRERGLEPHVVAVDSPGKDSIYRVRIGKFHSMDEARHFQSEIQTRHDLSTFITPL